MIPGRQEATAALYGCWRLARMDPTAMRWFDTSFEGFARSFVAVALMAAPASVLLAAYSGTQAPAMLAAYVLDIAAFPLVAAVLARLAGLSRGYVPYIVAHNWSAGALMLIQVPLILLAMAGEGATGLAILLLFILMIAILWYRWVIARLALGADFGMAVAFVALNFVIERGISLALIETPPG